MRGRWHVVEIEGFDVCGMPKDAGELASEVLNLVVGQRQAGEFGDVLDVGR